MCVVCWSMTKARRCVRLRKIDDLGYQLVEPACCAPGVSSRAQKRERLLVAIRKDLRQNALLRSGGKSPYTQKEIA